MKTAHLQPLAGVLRVFDTNKKYGEDPYEWAASVRWLNDHQVEILGVLKAPSLSQWRAIKQLFMSRNLAAVFRRVRQDGTLEIKYLS